MPGESCWLQNSIWAKKCKNSLLKIIWHECQSFPLELYFQYSIFTHNHHSCVIVAQFSFHHFMKVFSYFANTMNWETILSLVNVLRKNTFTITVFQMSSRSKSLDTYKNALNLPFSFLLYNIHFFFKLSELTTMQKI